MRISSEKEDIMLKTDYSPQDTITTEIIEKLTDESEGKYTRGKKKKKRRNS